MPLLRKKVNLMKVKMLVEKVASDHDIEKNIGYYKII